MIGSSTVGKTVMLVMQYLSSKNQLSDSRKNFRVHGGIITIDSNTTHLEDGDIDEIAIASGKFHDDKIILGTTGVIPPPHCMVVNYVKSNKNDEPTSETMTRCVLCFRDVVGESFIADDNEHRADFKQMSNFCRKSDGIFILADCTQLKKMYEISEGKLMRTDHPTNKIAERIRTEIFNKFGAVEKPAVSIVSKIDVLQSVTRDAKYSEIFLEDGHLKENNDDRRIDRHSAALAEGQDFAYDSNKNWYESVFKVINDATRDVLLCLDDYGTWSVAISTTFSNIAYFPVSSLGQEVDFVEVPDENFNRKLAEKKKEYADNKKKERKKKKESEKISYNQNVVPLPIASEEYNEWHTNNVQQTSEPNYEEINESYEMPSDEKIINKLLEEGAFILNKRIILKEHKKKLNVYTSQKIRELEERDHTDPISKVKPRGLALPLIYLLMKFGIIFDISDLDNYDTIPIKKGIVFKKVVGEETRLSDSKYKAWLAKYYQIPIDTSDFSRQYNSDTKIKIKTENSVESEILQQYERNNANVPKKIKKLTSNIKSKESDVDISVEEDNSNIDETVFAE